MMFNYPDLDILDSPLMSSTPLTSSLNGIPGSAIAENIFNDPDSWEENDDADDVGMEPLTWLADEIEKFKAKSADVFGTFDFPVDNKRNPGLTPTGEMQLSTGLKGIDRTSNIRPISIPCFHEPAHDEDIQDRLSKILDASGIPHYIRPLSSNLTPPSTSKINYYHPLKINTSIVAGSAMERPSPVAVHSSSITMSFLEWYGIYPESDQNLRSLRQQYRKSINSKIAGSMIPPPIQAMPLSPPSSIPPPGLEPPPHLPRSRSPSFTSSTESPPHRDVRRQSPAGSRPNSNPRSRSSSDSRSQSPTRTQDISRRDSDTPTRRRRLPSIPLEASPLPPPRSSPKFLSTELPAPASQQIRPPSTSRPLPSICSPAGPRTRAGSRVNSQDSTTRGVSLQYRPPALRL